MSFDTQSFFILICHWSYFLSQCLLIAVVILIFTALGDLSFFPFTRQDGVYLAQIVHVSPDSSDIRDFGQVPVGDSLPTAFSVITHYKQNSSAVSVDSAFVTVFPVAGSALPLDSSAPSFVLPVLVPQLVPAVSLGTGSQPVNLTHN
jgi:hypothetical protein